MDVNKNHLKTLMYFTQWHMREALIYRTYKIQLREMPLKFKFLNLVRLLDNFSKNHIHKNLQRLFLKPYALGQMNLFKLFKIHNLEQDSLVLILFKWEQAQIIFLKPNHRKNLNTHFTLKIFPPKRMIQVLSQQNNHLSKINQIL